MSWTYEMSQEWVSRNYYFSAGTVEIWQWHAQLQRSVKVSEASKADTST